MSNEKTRILQVYEAWPLKKAQWSCPDRGELPLTPVTADKSAVSALPFPLPERLDPTLNELCAYWNSLRRGNAGMPFTDDVKLGEVGKLSNLILLVEVFQKPERFRFNIVGDQIARRYGGELAGQFADEIPARAPLDYFLSQCSTTVEAHVPTFYRHAPRKGAGSEYERIILPFWADGHIGALLGAIKAAEETRK